MPLTHLQNQERRRQARRADRQPGEPEENKPEMTPQPEDSEMPVSFAPLPPTPSPTMTEAVTSNEARNLGAAEETTAAPMVVTQTTAVPPPLPASTPPQSPVGVRMQAPTIQYVVEDPTRPSENVKILHQVGPYPVGSVVPVSCFADIDRLLRLKAVAYTYEMASQDATDHDIETAMSLARPVMSNRGIPHAPWVQSTLLDILGPAVPQSGVPRQTTGHWMVPSEAPERLGVAQPNSRIPQGATWTGVTGTVLSPEQMADAANEGFAELPQRR